MAEAEDEVCGRILLDVLDQNVNSDKIVNWLQNSDPNELFKNCSRSAFIRWYMRWIRDQCEPLFTPTAPITEPVLAAQPSDPRQHSTYDNNFPTLSAAPKTQANPKQNRRIHPVLLSSVANANNIQNVQVDAKQQVNNIASNIAAPTIAPADNKNQRRTSAGSDQQNVWGMNKQHTNTNTNNKQPVNSNLNANNNSKPKFDLNNFPEVNRAQNSYKNKTKAHRVKPQQITPSNNNTTNNTLNNTTPQPEAKTSSQQNTPVPKLADPKATDAGSSGKTQSGSETNSLKGSQEINAEISSVSLAIAEKFLNLIQHKKEVDALSSILAAIFNSNLSLNLAHDLEFLMKLFSLKISWEEDASKKSSKSSADSGANNSWKKFEELLKQIEVFKSNNNAIYFACKVVSQSISIIKNFGNANLHLLTSNPILHVIGYEIVEQLNDIKHQNVLHVPSTDASKPDPDFSIPLRLESETTKNMLKTNAERNVFNNREKCRDNFPKLLQELMSDPDYKNNVQSKMKDFLKQLLPQNYPFFASLFQAELLKHALNADEFDKQLAELTDPTKLRKLNQRMTERRADNSQNYSNKQRNNNNGTSNNSGYNGSNNNNSRPPPQQYKHKGVTYFNTNSSNSNNKGQFKPRPDKEFVEKDPFEGLFLDKEEKFFQMLYSVNNYCLNMNIISQMRNKILELSNFHNTEQVEDRFAERILKLKVLSKFLSFLIHWPTIVSYNLDSTTLMPLGDALKSANRTDSSFDILLCLKQAQATSSLTLNLPWIIEHVKIMKLDKLTSETEHFKRIVNTLKFVYISSSLTPKNESFNINSLFILNELEKCFEYLQTDPSDIDWNLIANNTSGDKSTSPFKNFIYSPVKKQTNVDSRSDLLNQNFIYLCFPYLDEFSSVLKEFNSQFFSTTPRQPQARTSFAVSKLPTTMVKKITPVRPQNVKKSEQLLHHWFFWQHPALSSLSDVVSKRVLSFYQSEILDLTPTLIDDLDLTMLYTPTKSLIIETDGRLEQLVLKVIESGCKKVKPQIPAKITDAMRCLADYNTDARVLDAAIKLTIEHVTLTLPEFIIDNVRSRIKKIIEERMSKKQKSPAKLATQPTVKRILPGGTTSPSSPSDIIPQNTSNITSPTKFSGEIQNDTSKVENQNFGFDADNSENMTEEEKEEERIRQLNKVKTRKANRMHNSLSGLITKLGEISEKYVTVFKHYNSDSSHTELFSEEEDFNTFLHSFFNEVHATCLIWASRVLQLHVTDVEQRDPLFASLKNVEALTVAFEQWMDIGFYVLSLCSEELTLQMIKNFQYNMDQIRTEHIEIEYQSVPQKTEVICFFVKIIAELGARDHRLTFLVPSYLLNDSRINTLVLHNIHNKQIQWQSAVNSTMLYLLESNLVNTLCIEESFLEALNSPLKENTAYSTAIRALLASFLHRHGPGFFIRLRAEAKSS